MPKQQDQKPTNSQTPLLRLSSTSYVYPVRSLLEGRIQPATESPPTRPPLMSRSSDDIVGLLNQKCDLKAGFRSRSDTTPQWFRSQNPGDANDQTLEDTQTTLTRTDWKDTGLRRRSSVSISDLSRASNEHASGSSTTPDRVDVGVSSLTGDRVTSKGKRRKSTRARVNFSHFPAGENPYFPRTFSTGFPTSTSTTSDPSLLESVQSSMSADQVLGNQINEIFFQRPYSSFASPLPNDNTDDSAIPTTSIPLLAPTATADRLDLSVVRPLHQNENTLPESHETAEGVPLVIADLPSSFSPSLDFYPVETPIATYPGGLARNEGIQMSEQGLYLPFNPSEYGIVHLPPLPDSRGASDRGSSSMSSRHDSSKSRPSQSGHRVKKGSRTGSTSATGSRGSRERETRASTMSPGASFGTPSSGQSQQGSSEAFSSDGFGSSIASDEPYTTFRFRSLEDENGNHVVLGREGKLDRCEDEPIRTPGAVQGFGVLIAIDEKDDVLLVRQVSENSSELLGLPPSYLFGLECFTEILPDSQAGILWDNVEFLAEPDRNSDEEECTPHVFLLSGYGAPGSALPNESDAEDGKRLWTCWCAIHRSQVQNDITTTPGLIIMEFELERDNMNPLYPPSQSSSTSNEESYASTSDSTPVDERQHSHSPLGSVSTGSGQSTAGKLSSTSDTTLPTTGSTISQSTTPPFGLPGDSEWHPTAEDIIESTTSHSRPLPALERLRRMTRAYGTSADEAPSPTRRGQRRNAHASSAVGMMDIFAVMTQINEQLGAAPDLETYLKIVVGVIKDLTQFHRVMVYQFDELWNGHVVSELLDWSQSRDLFKGLHFPAGDIPAQARQLYELNKVRLLYDATQPTARIVVRSKEELVTPLDMTHCYLRAMSPIHIQYLENMGVRASMSISIMGFGQLWGLINCHTYGLHGMRVSFPIRQMLRLLSQSISKNIERLSYAQRLHTRKLINTVASEHHPTGYIVSNADDLLGLFDADFGILVIGEGAKILGPNQHGQEILIMAEYLRMKQYDTIQASQAVVSDFPDLELTAGFEIIAGLLYVPLSSGGKDFIAFLRKGQPREVRWAGRPHKAGSEKKLEPRTSFKIWSETVAGRSRMWTDEQLETAGVLALVYGKFIEVWREKENALQTTKLTNLLLSNASHEVRTPLNHIINYLEMAMNGPLDGETRENLSKSHAASKSLLFTINDLLDLTRLEIGNETSFNEPFNLHFTIEDATHLYRKEADRRNITFNLELAESPITVIGDAKKIRTVVQNLTANALKYTFTGSITVSCTTFGEPEGLRRTNQTAVEILVADTGCGIAPEKLESIFREFEQVESSEPKPNNEAGVGLGLAVVARIVEQLGGQLRVDSTENKGSRFSFLIPLALAVEDSISRQGTSSLSSGSSRASPGIRTSSRAPSIRSEGYYRDDIDNLVQALSSSPIKFSRESLPSTSSDSASFHRRNEGSAPSSSIHRPSNGMFEVAGSQVPVRPVKIHSLDVEMTEKRKSSPTSSLKSNTLRLGPPPPSAELKPPMEVDQGRLRVLIVEDNDINRTILAKRLSMNGHLVVNTTNGQEGLDKVVTDRSFDAVLMDLQMPILNGFEATQKIREFENAPNVEPIDRPSHALNGRLPIFAVSASLLEQQRDELAEYGMDGWILKPIDFKRLNVILKGVIDPSQRQSDVYRPGCSWERGGWLKHSAETK